LIAEMSLDQRDNQPDRGLDCTPDNRRISLE
jgi:hypothetical protein